MRPLIALELTASADDLVGDELLHCRQLHDGLGALVGLGGVVLGHPGEHLHMGTRGKKQERVIHRVSLCICRDQENIYTTEPIVYTICSVLVTSEYMYTLITARTAHTT